VETDIKDFFSLICEESKRKTDVNKQR